MIEKLIKKVNVEMGGAEEKAKGLKSWLDTRPEDELKAITDGDLDVITLILAKVSVSTPIVMMEPKAFMTVAFSSYIAGYKRGEEVGNLKAKMAREE